MLNNTKFIGHRGNPSNKYLFENTLDSFIEAAKSPLDGIETDIWPTKDDKFVCCHDARPFQWSFRKIYNLTFDQIKNKKIHGSFDYPRDNPGSFNNAVFSKKKETIPLFDDFLKICINFNKLALIELKHDRSWTELNPGLWTESRIDQLVKMLIDSKYDLKKIWLISLDNDLLIHIQKKYPFMQIMCIIDTKNDIEQYRDPNYFLQNNISIDVGDCDSASTKDWGIKISQELIDNFHKKKLLIGAWTVNEEIRAEALVNLGIDFITSDYIHYKLVK